MTNQDGVRGGSGARSVQSWSQLDWALSPVRLGDGLFNYFCTHTRVSHQRVDVTHKSQ